MSLHSLDSFEERVKLLPFVTLFVALALGVLASLWSLIALPLLFLKWLRPYVVVFICGGVLYGALECETLKLQSGKRCKNVIVLTERVSTGYYGARLLTGECRGASVLFEDERFEVGDTISATYFAENIKPAIASKGIDNRLLRDGYRQRLLLDEDSLVNYSRGGVAPLVGGISSRLDSLCGSYKCRALLSSLLLGDRDAMSANQKSSFRKVGLSHVLAVSGLHVGIICFILSVILYPLNFVFSLRTLKKIVIVLLLWGYVWLVGAPASAIRAASLFSLLSIVYLQSRGVLVMANLLFGTAFVMLLFKTSLLYDIGFQLSFVAVLGISIVVPYVNKISGESRFMRYLLGSIAVTLAAQIATLPLLLYHFGAFSTISIITNTLIAPLIAPFMFFAIVALIFNSNLIMWCSERLSDAIDFIISIFVKVPYGYISELDFDGWDLLLSYIAISLLLIVANRRRVK